MPGIYIFITVLALSCLGGATVAPLQPNASVLLLSIFDPGALVWNLLEQESPAVPSFHISMTLPDRKETLI